jgi:hypothetical protein
MSDDESRPDNAPSRKHIAFHEAAHFVVAYETNGYPTSRFLARRRRTIDLAYVVARSLKWFQEACCMAC